MRTPTDWPPSLAAATAWLAPLPPGNIWKLLPSTVSPGAGNSRTPTTKSMLRLPTTTIAAFRNVPLVRAHLCAREPVNLRLRHQQLRNRPHDVQPHFVRFFLHPQLARFAQRRHDLVRHIADLVPRQLHLVARITPRRPDHLALGDELILGAAEHLLVADPLAPHVVAVLPQDVAHLFVQAVFYGQFFSDDVIDDLGDSLGI